MKTDLDIEIGQLIRKLEKEVKEDAHACVEIPFEEDAYQKDFDEKIKDRQSVWNRVWIPDPQLHYVRPLQSSKKSVKIAVIFIKKLIRACIRFVIVPILDEQSVINYSVKAELDRLHSIVERQEDQILKLQKQNRDYSYHYRNKNDRKGV